MRISMSGLIIEKILNQAGKITVLRVTGRVRPKLEISRISNKIYHRLWACFLSKNALLTKNYVTIAPCILGNLSLPTT
jgi:hypothetical protein